MSLTAPGRFRPPRWFWRGPSPFSDQPDDSDQDSEPVLDAPATVQSEGPSSRQESSLLYLGGGAILLIGGIAAWTRWRDRAGCRGYEAAARRRWEEHWLSGADDADARQLLKACVGDREQMKCLINFELSREANISREEAIKRAFDRWRREEVFQLDVERALSAVIQEARVQGVSTRSVDELV